MTFYVGVHTPAWLGRTDVPLFLTYRRVARIAKLPRALGPWALDSGGYTELASHGRWTIPPATYAREVRRFADTVGRLDFACVQDWICAPPARAATGLSVEEHLERTVASFVELRQLDPGLPWAPVLQGWEPADYLRCAELYAEAGVDLQLEPVVALGSIANRQGTPDAVEVVRAVAALGLRLHGLGVKGAGLELYAGALASADSQAWSFRARRAEWDRELQGGPARTCGAGSHCGNCLHAAVEWRAALLERIGPPFGLHPTSDP